MVSEESKIIMRKIRNKEIDINNQSQFFSILIKGLIYKLNSDISIREESVPHMVLNTGDDTMWLSYKGQNASIEPLSISNEDYIYNIIPRCVVDLGSIDLEPAQLTNPYARCEFQLETDNNIYMFSAECRRLPIKVNCELTYYVDSYRDMMELIQQIMSKLCFVQTYKIVYQGQTIICSYKIPENFNEEHLAEIDGSTTDNKYRKMNLSIEIESNFPVFDGGTIVDSNNLINLSPSNSTELLYGKPKTLGSVKLDGSKIPDESGNMTDPKIKLYPTKPE